MALIRVGQGIVDIRGSVGGVYFHRDKTGLHACRHPRTVQQRSSAQAAQRKAFATAREYSKVNRVVSYNIYRALNGLAPADPPIDYRLDMK